MANSKFQDLRQEAEKILRSTSGDRFPRDGRGLLEIVHELEVHQVELEIQNDELRRTQEALLEARDLYFDLYDLAPVGYLELDEKGLIRNANLAAAKLFGFPRSQLVRRPLSRFVVPKDRQKVLTQFRRLQESDEKRVCEVRIANPSGKPCFAQLESAPEKDGEDRFSGCRSVLTDTTGRVMAEQALRESENRFRELFESAPVAYQSLDANGDILIVNQAWLEILGFKRADVIGRSFADFLIPENRSYFRDSFNQFKDTGEVSGLEFELMRKDGEPVLVSVQGKTVTDQEGNFCCAHFVIFDITQARKAEKQQEELELKLRQAEKLNSIGTLAGGIAHDFNNSLAAIMGYSELALNGLTEDHVVTREVAQDIEEVLRACQRAKKLVEQILSFSQTKYRHKAALQVSSIVSEALDLLRPLISSSIEIKTRLKDSDDLALVDPTQIQQVMMNICINAAQAMEQDEGVLEIELKTVELEPGRLTEGLGLAPGYYQELKISDTGKGMDQKVLERIFEPFYTTKPVGKGTGMGLSVVHGIVKAHGGAVVAESTPGAGSIFTVYLPVCESEED